MDKSIPAGAVMLLDFIASFESGGKYDVIYGEHQGQLSTPITQLNLASLLAKQDMWGKMWGSSAAGRYQIMPTTLKSLMSDLGLTGADVFSPDLQDRLGFQLLKRRGYNQFMTGAMNLSDFGKQLAEEWASLPVLATTKGEHTTVNRGQSFYESDGLNHSLIDANTVEQLLVKVQGTKLQPGWIPQPEPKKPLHPAVVPGAGAVVVVAAPSVAKALGLSLPLSIILAVALLVAGTVAYSVLKGKTKWF